MGFILSLIANPMAALQMIGVGVVAFGLGFGGGYIKGFDGAIAKYQVASLKEEVRLYKKAAEDTAKQLEEDRALAESQENQRAALETEIERTLHATANRSDACRLNSEQLLRLRSYIAKSN
jgi:hypothetical protein